MKRIIKKKADTNTLKAVKHFLKSEEGWSIEDLVDSAVEGSRKYGTLSLIAIEPDEYAIVYDDQYVCSLDEFLTVYTRVLLEKVCNVLDSFKGERLSDYEGVEDNEE